MAEFLSSFSGWLWGNLLFILLGGGAFFALFSRFSPFRYLGHGFQLLFGKYPEKEAPGEVSHFRALCSALSGTVGMGNVAGVAVARLLTGAINVTSCATGSPESSDVSLLWFLSESQDWLLQSDDNFELLLCAHLPKSISQGRSCLALSHQCPSVVENIYVFDWPDSASGT